MTESDFPYVGELPPESWAALDDALFTPQRLAEAPAMVEDAVGAAARLCDRCRGRIRWRSQPSAEALG
jgi:hypothetical protein